MSTITQYCIDSFKVHVLCDLTSLHFYGVIYILLKRRNVTKSHVLRHNSVYSFLSTCSIMLCNYWKFCIVLPVIQNFQTDDQKHTL